jgi:hypothetical protein
MNTSGTIINGLQIFVNIIDTEHMMPYLKEEPFEGLNLVFFNRQKDLLTRKYSKSELGKTRSIFDKSFENRFIMRPIGFKSKKRTFVLTIDLNIVLCSVLDAIEQYLKSTIARSTQATVVSSIKTEQKSIQKKQFIRMSSFTRS